MSQFTANVIAKLDSSKAEAQLKALCRNQTVDLKVNLTGIDSKALSNLVNQQTKVFSATGVNAGKQFVSSMGKGLKGGSTQLNGFYKNYFKGVEKQNAQAASIASKYSVTEKQALGAIKAKQSAQTKANNEYNRQLVQRQKLEQQVDNRWQNNLYKQEQKQFVQRQKAQTEQQRYIDFYSKKFELGNYKAQQDSMNSKLGQYSNSNSDALSSARKYYDEYSKIQDTLSKHYSGETKLSNNDLVKYFNDSSDAAKKFSSQMSIVANDSSKNISSFSAITKSNQIQKYAADNSKALKLYGTELKSLAQDAKNAQTKMDLDNVNSKFNALKSTISEKGLTGNSWLNEVGRGFKKIGEFVGVYGILQRGVGVVKQMGQAVYDVDTSMTELRKVSSASGGEIDKYFDTAATNAKKYGDTISDMINATADWSRMGYSLPQSSKLAEVSSLYKNVGDGIDIDTANKSLISTLQGFELGTDQAESVIDKFNEVSNNYAIDSAGIGEALQHSAASFNASNTDLSKSIALITGANKVVQDPAAVGNMWKTVAMRIRSTKQELIEAGEDTDGVVESTAKLRELVKGTTGFDIMADEAGTQFKDIYDIVVGIGEQWSKITDLEQAGLLEALAGKRQGNALAAALNNVDEIKAVYQTAEYESEGSAMRENEAYMDSLAGKIGQFKASFQDLSNSLIGSDLLKGFVDFGTGAIDILDSVIDKLGFLGTAITGIAIGKGIFSLVKNFD